MTPQDENAPLFGEAFEKMPDLAGRRLPAAAQQRQHTETTEQHGLFETIYDTGGLVLKTPTGRVTVPAADIFFP